MGRVGKRLSSFQIIILGFAAVILSGALFLMLPGASRDGNCAPFGDALFTSVSAVCVTGLVVRDTARSWSLFGQCVILFLIQIGGLGVVTAAVALSKARGERLSLKQRSTMQEAISAQRLGGLGSMTGLILRVTLLSELLGAVCMAPVFCRRFGVEKGMFYALFHAVSAFCNAGFDLMGEAAPYSSLTDFPAEPLICIPVMLLIITGGIGFATWADVRQHRGKLQRYRMQTRVILFVTGLLILIPALYFCVFEFHETSGAARILGALFQSVTPRTAGFNTLDLTVLSENGRLLMIFLMLTGGAPGSTAGGIKVTTLAVLLASESSVFRRRAHPRMFGRRISDETVRTAAAVLVMYLFLFLTGGCLISGIEGLPLLTCLFETASAVGTVGLTLGITPELGSISRGILIILMFVGRVGGLTVLWSAIPGKGGSPSRLPEGKIANG